MKSQLNTNKIIFVAPSLSSFVKNDIVILSKNFNVVLNIYSWNKKYYTPFFLIHQFYFILRNLRFTKSIFISFGGYWSLIPAVIGRVFKIPVFIILNGTDCASIPPLHYGDLRKFPLKLFCKFSYKLAYELLPVSKSLVTTKNIYHSDDEFSFQGYKHFFPKIITKYHILANGIDEHFWKPIENIDREQSSFITVLSDSQFVLKGGPLIIELAKQLTNCKFYFAGLNKMDYLEELPSNVFFLGKLTPENLRHYYLSSQYYLQLSVYEGFGVSLCEAMLCECIPIGSSVNIIPEIIGDSGFILEKESIDELVFLVKTVMKIENKREQQDKARNRIIENYNLQRRAEEMLDLIEQIIN